MLFKNKFLNTLILIYFEQIKICYENSYILFNKNSQKQEKLSFFGSFKLKFCQNRTKFWLL